MRHDFAGIVRRRAPVRCRIDVQLDAAAADLLEVVGVDLNLVGQRGVRRRRKDCGERSERRRN